VELELGAGDGSFLLKYSGLHPERNFIGVERLLGRLRKIDRKGRRLGLTNLRALRLEASYVLEWMIQPGSLAALHVYFPDPWPKRRHWRRRLVNERFVELAARALKPGGHFHVRTDDAPYFEQMLAVGNGQTAFQPAETPAELLAVVTDFEADFNAGGIPTRHSSWVRTDGPVVYQPSPNPPLAP
jgi:tRNA (guanine-N7-)-methyltransferase